jgi:hypothetical protein
VSIHVPTETDDPNFEGLTGARATKQIKEGAVSTGSAGKYSPINQERARRAGFATPENTAATAASVASFGQIHPREP